MQKLKKKLKKKLLNANLKMSKHFFVKNNLFDSSYIRNTSTIQTTEKKTIFLLVIFMEFILPLMYAIELVCLLLIFVVYTYLCWCRQRQIGNKDHQSVTSFSCGKMALHWSTFDMYLCFYTSTSTRYIPQAGKSFVHGKIIFRFFFGGKQN